MNEDNRQHRRIEKRITMRFCLADMSPKRWDMSFVDNISVGGIKFKASSDLKLTDKIIQLQIKIPELSPKVLEINALVLSAIPRLNGKTLEIRAKFVDLSDKDKEDLSVLETSINWHKIIDSKNAGGKK